MQTNQIELKKVDLEYFTKSGKITIFNNLSLEIKRGEKIGIIGKSGSGKTSLLRLLYKSISTVKNTEKKFKASILGQFPLINPWLTCYEHLLFCANNSIKKDYYDVDDLLKQVGLFEKKKQQINSLSLGEKQRLVLISHLFLGSDIILTDEPFARLDTEKANICINLFDNFIKNNRLTWIMTTHNLNQLKIFTKIYSIKNHGLERVK